MLTEKSISEVCVCYGYECECVNDENVFTNVMYDTLLTFTRWDIKYELGRKLPLRELQYHLFKIERRLVAILVLYRLVQEGKLVNVSKFIFLARTRLEYELWKKLIYALLALSHFSDIVVKGKIN